MNKHKQHGFAVTALLAVIVLAIVIAGGIFALQKNKNNTSNSQKDQGENSQQSKENENNKNSKQANESQLVIENVGLKSFDDMVYDKYAVQDYKVSGHKALYVFGDPLPGTPVRQNPNFEFASVNKDTEIISAIDGVVVFIKDQPDSKDSEVFLSTFDGSEWIIGYDHVVNLKVKKGDSVKVGTVLGNPAVQNNGLYRFEFQINKQNSTETTHYCPINLLSEKAKASVIAELTTSLQKWETLAGQELYTQEKQDPMGCIKPTLTLKEAEGTN